MPHSSTIPRSKVRCPLNHSIDLGDDNYSFDYASEMIDDDEWYALSVNTIGILGNLKIPFPVACRDHNIVFMCDFKKGVGYAPRDDKERNMCEKLILGLKNKEKNPNIFNERFEVYDTNYKKQRAAS